MSNLPDLSRFKAEPPNLAGQKRRSDAHADEAEPARPNAPARTSLFPSRPGGRRTSSGSSKAVRLNALYPEFLQSRVQAVLTKHSNSAADAMSELGQLSKQIDVPALSSLESFHRQVYDRLVSKFDDFDPKKVLCALSLRDWNEAETDAHLGACRRALNVGHPTRSAASSSSATPASTRETVASRKDFHSSVRSTGGSLSPAVSSSEVLDNGDDEVTVAPSRKFRRGAPPTASRSGDTASSRTLSSASSATSSPQSASGSMAKTDPWRAPAPGSVQMGRPAPGISTLRDSSLALPASSKPSSAPAPVKSRPQNPQQHSVTIVVSDGSGGEDEEDMASDSGADSDTDGDTKKMESALSWFNKATENALCETIGCSAAQSATIVRLRPFEDEDDVDAKLGDRSAKGVTPRLFHACVEVMAGYQQIDRILHRVEGVGRRLMKDMRRWALETPHVSARDADIEPIPPAQARSEGFLSEQPKGLSGHFRLKPYQMAGVNWLTLLYNHHLSAILADEMGLGKTVQVISFLLALKARGEPGPHLVVAPSSVLENWRRELEQAANSERKDGLHVAVYWGSQKERDVLRDEIADMQDAGELDIVLTTYDMASSGGTAGRYDAKFFRRRNFNMCVFDEGHMLKNRRSERYQKLMKIPAERRLLLTGTPLQNHLGELLSLLNFILPTYFGDADSELLESIFKAKPTTTSIPGANMLSSERVERAKALMKPFVLRRRKEKVLAHELAGKIERVVRCDMTPAQAQVYADVLAGARRSVEEEAIGDAEGKQTIKAKAAAAAKFDEKKIAALARDYVKNPDYADEPLDHVKEDFSINSDAVLSQVAEGSSYTKKHVLPSKAWLDSGKVKALREIIEEATSKGERVLIFSQFTTVLDILIEALHVMGIAYLGFTGATRVEDRQLLVDQFTNDESIPVFLLTTRAGGVGINLTAASWVVLFDQDFNPHNDKQAIDRAHRLGQKRDVTVVRLLSKDTIDDQIYALGSRKLELAQRVSDDQPSDRKPKRASIAKPVNDLARADEDEDEDEDKTEAMNNDDIQKLVSTSIIAQIRAGPSPVKAKS